MKKKIKIPDKSIRAIRSALLFYSAVLLGPEVPAESVSQINTSKKK